MVLLLRHLWPAINRINKSKQNKTKQNKLYATRTENNQEVCHWDILMTLTHRVECSFKSVIVWEFVRRLTSSLLAAAKRWHYWINGSCRCVWFWYVCWHHQTSSSPGLCWDTLGTWSFASLVLQSSCSVSAVVLILLHTYCGVFRLYFTLWYTCKSVYFTVLFLWCVYQSVLLFSCSCGVLIRMFILLV